MSVSGQCASECVCVPCALCREVVVPVQRASERERRASRDFFACGGLSVACLSTTTAAAAAAAMPRPGRGAGGGAEEQQQEEGYA